MAISLVNHASQGNTTAVASLTTTIPSVTAGNLVIVAIAASGGLSGALPTVTDNASTPNPYTTVGSGSTPHGEITIAYGVAVTGGATSVTVTPSGTGRIAVIIEEWSGLLATQASVLDADTFVVVNSSGGTLSLSTGAGDLLFTAMDDTTVDSAWGAGGGYTQDANSPVTWYLGSTHRLSAAYYGSAGTATPTSAGTQTQTWSWTGGGITDGAGLVAFKPAAGGYTVTFNANGGTGSLASEGPYSGSHALSLFSTGSMAYTGHAFTGWNTAANGSGTAYADGASFPFTASVTLYAQWVSTAGSGAGTTTQTGTAAGTWVGPAAPIIHLRIGAQPLVEVGLCQSASLVQIGIPTVVGVSMDIMTGMDASALRTPVDTPEITQRPPSTFGTKVRAFFRVLGF